LPRARLDSREIQDQTQQSQLQIYEQNSHELDEIINTSEFAWEGEEGLSFFLGSLINKANVVDMERK
jgi:hypothetical protein